MGPSILSEGHFKFLNGGRWRELELLGQSLQTIWQLEQSQRYEVSEEIGGCPIRRGESTGAVARESPSADRGAPAGQTAGSHLTEHRQSLLTL